MTNLEQVTITILVENTVNRRGLLAEHGVSFLMPLRSV
jgi:metal-dependent hydrolase (beta-lactamase superfamily II)